MNNFGTPDPGESRQGPQKSDSGTTEENAIACDYVDVERIAGDQPRFRLQPHLSGGRVGVPAFTLEAEGARGLVQHLQHLLMEGT
jgi:hypothetical protein